MDTASALRQPQTTSRRSAGTVLLQPNNGAELTVILRVDPIDSEAHRQRIARDAQTVLEIQLEASLGRRERAWENQQRDLYGYASTTMPAMIRDGRIFTVVTKVLGVQANDLQVIPSLHLSREDIEDLVIEAVTRALPAFKADLLAGRWDPTAERIASLRTFFIGKCAPPFVTAWRHLLRHRQGELRLQKAMSLQPLPTGPATTETTALNRVEIIRALSGIADRDQRITVLDACGFTDPEIAAREGTTTKAVEYRLTRIRQNLRETRGDVA